MLQANKANISLILIIPQTFLSFFIQQLANLIINKNMNKQNLNKLEF